jgi:hypothetical protein
MSFKVVIGFIKPNGEIDHQNKTFKNDLEALAFCHKHREKIDSINYCPFKKLNIFTGKERYPDLSEMFDMLFIKTFLK